MAERIRANSGERQHYDTRTALIAAGDCATAFGCDRASLASHDLAAFDAAIRRLLPHQQPGFAITFEPAIGPATVDRFSLSLYWRDRRDPDTTDEVTLSLLAQSPVAGAA